MQRRKRLLVNWSVQGPLLVRLVVHFVTFGCVWSAMLIVCWICQRSSIESDIGAISEPLNVFWYRLLPMAGCTLALLPFILYDMVRITNRIAGPLYRFEQTMNQFEETGVLPETGLRQNDLLTGFNDRFNRFAAVMHERYPDCQPVPSGTSEVESTETRRAEELLLV